MLEDIYKKQIGRLRSSFGEKKFPDEMVKTMWWRLKGFSEDIFIAGVDTLICEAKFPPKLSEIVEHCNQARAKIVRLVAERNGCLACKNQGIRFAIHRANGCEYSFRCPECNLQDFAAIPVWEDKLSALFKIIDLEKDY